MVNTDKLRGKITERRMSVSDLAIQIGLNPSTLYRKLTDGNSFTIGEVDKIKNALELNNEEASCIFFT